MDRFPVVLVIFVLIILINGIVRFIKWLNKIAENPLPQQPAHPPFGAGGFQPRVGLDGDRPAPPNEVRAFLERARAQQMARQMGGVPPRPASPSVPIATIASEPPWADENAQPQRIVEDAPTAQPPAASAPKRRRGRMRPPETRPQAPAAPAPPTAPPAVAAKVRAALRPSKKTLRKAMIWSEILKPPVALRRGRRERGRIPY